MTSSKKRREITNHYDLRAVGLVMEPTQNDRFINIIDMHYPTWHEAQAELNDLLLAAEAWSCIPCGSSK
jgi:hypothetical protein